VPDGETPVSLDKNLTIFQINSLENDTEYTFKMSIVYTDTVSVSNVTLSATPGDITAYTTNPKKPIAGEEIAFAFNPAFLPQSTAVSFTWDFGDGTTSEEQEPAYVYTTPGKYTVKLTIVDNDGLTFNAESDLNIIGEIWSFDTGDEIRSSSPVVGADGTIYVGGDTDLVYAFNVDGTVKWTFDTGGDVDCSPSLGADGTIYIGSQGGKFHALDPADGSEKWSIAAQSVDFFYATPAIGADGSIYIGCRDGNVYALNTDGTSKWTYTTTGSIRGSVAIGALGDIYIANDNGDLYALRETDGAVTWTINVVGRDEGGIAIGVDGTLYLGTGGDDDQLRAIDPTDGTTKWSYQAGADVLASPVIDAAGIVYVTSRDGNVYAINPDGSLKWISSFMEFRGAAAIGEDGTVYVGHYGETDPGLYALNANDGTVEAYFPTGRIWSSPVISDGKIYFGAFDFKFYALEMFAGNLQTDAQWSMRSKDASHTGRL
jgi:outer membrane protein assembly factor BamB